MTSQSAFNPVAQAHRMMWRNLLQDVSARPWLSGFLGLLTVFFVWLVWTLALTAVEQHSELLEFLFRDHPLPVWAGVFVLLMASQVPLARRQARAATNGWLATLPQMPQAARRHSARTRWLLCLLHSALLLVALALLAQHFTSPMPWFNWLLALALPAAAGLAPGCLAGAPAERAETSAMLGSLSPADQSWWPAARILQTWQWRAFREAFWAPATRWAIGGLLILIPAGASTAGVAATLLVGWLLIQAMNAWASWMRVIVQASLLLQALPTGTTSLLWTLSVLPLVLIATGSLFLSLGPMALGASLAIGLVVGLLVPAVSLLVLASVLAWRHQHPIPQWRILMIVMLWLLIAQSLPPVAPVFWLLLMFLLIRRAYKQ